MTAPQLSIAIQPLEGGKVAYLPIAASGSDRKAQVKIVVRLRLTNNSAQTLTLSDISFNFPGSTVAKRTMQGVKIAVSSPTDPDPDDGRIPPGAEVTWSNGVVDLDTTEAGENKVRNEVYLTLPVPPKLRVDVRCQGFSDPVSGTWDLVPYTQPTGDSAFVLPFAASDLDDGEYIVTSALHWANGGPNGAQIYAHDIGIQGRVDGSWTAIRPGGDKQTNAGYRIFGMPVRAMADGTVLSWKDDTDENPKPGEKPDDPPEGNHFWIRHGDVKVKYAHLKKGSQPAALKQAGAVVRAGQAVGQAGNNGNSSGPHLHIECVHIDSNSLRGMPFADGWVLERSRVAADHSGPWVRLKADGLCTETTAIWPATTAPRVVVPAAGIVRSATHALRMWTSASESAFKADVQKLFDEKGLRLLQSATYLERGHRRWVGLAGGGDWGHTFWTSASLAAFKTKAQALFDDKGQRLEHVHTFPVGAGRRWAGIARSGHWASSFWVSDSLDAFKSEVKSLWETKQRRLAFCTTYREGSARRWVGIARSGAPNSVFWVSPTLQAFSAKVQKLFDEQGLRLEHVHSFVEDGQRRWAGISRAGTGANHFWVSGDWDHFRRQVQRYFDDHGERASCIELLDHEA